MIDRTTAVEVVEGVLLTPQRILAIDYGDRRVGISISDPMNIIAQGLPTLKNDSSLIGNLRSIVDDHCVVEVIVGMPYTLRGEIGRKAKEVEEFIERLDAELGVPVRAWDERFTSRMAHAAIRNMGTRQKDRRKKERVDEMASRLLLQSYLDNRKQDRG